MTTKRRTANPAYQMPLTKEPPKPLKGKLICCKVCGQAGGMLVRIDDKDKPYYRHEDCPAETNFINRLFRRRPNVKKT